MIEHGPTYIYSSASTWSISVKGAQEMLGTALDPRGIKIIDTLTHVNKETKLLVMPGGASPFIPDELKYEGARKVVEYVNGGGRYLGICAGAILATHNVVQGVKLSPPGYEDFRDKGLLYRDILDIKNDSGINRHKWYMLYPGTYHAPFVVNDYRDACNPINFCAVDVTSTDESCKDSFKIIHFSGPAFFSKPDVPKAKTLLTYNDPLTLYKVKLINSTLMTTGDTIRDDNPIAALSYPYGNGKIVLSGVHPEINPESFACFAMAGNFPPNLPEGIAESEPGRLAFVNRIFQELDIDIPMK